MTETTAAIIAEALAGDVVDETEKDWTYLLEKEPSSNHVLFAKIMREKLGAEVVDNATPEQMIYWLLAMHRWMQKTQANRARPEFRGRTWGSVLRGYETLAQRAAAEAVDAPVTEAIPVTLEEKAKVAASKAVKAQPKTASRATKAAAAKKAADEVIAEESAKPAAKPRTRRTRTVKADA